MLNDCRVARGGAGPRAAAGRGGTAPDAGPAPDPARARAHRADHSPYKRTRYDTSAPEDSDTNDPTCAPSPIRQRNLRGPARRPHDAIVIVRSAFSVFGPLPPRAPPGRSSRSRPLGGNSGDGRRHAVTYASRAWWLYNRSAAAAGHEETMRTTAVPTATGLGVTECD